MSETIALIPARGGSERILRKNIRKFSGRPIIAWSIELAKRSEIFDRIVVSTDDHEIAETALNEGAEVPFIRPSKLSDSGTGITLVVKHAILKMQQSDIVVRELCLIYATAPFLQIDALKKGLELLHAEDCDYVISVTTYASPIQRAVKRTANGRLAMFQPDSYNSRSQDLETAYHDAAQFCWGTINAWLEERPAYGANTVPIVLPRHLVQDIDTEEEWRSAEWKFKAIQASGDY